MTDWATLDSRMDAAAFRTFGVNAEYQAEGGPVTAARLDCAGVCRMIPRCFHLSGTVRSTHAQSVRLFMHWFHN